MTTLPAPSSDGRPTTPVLVIANEFARVQLSVDDRANGVRLRIRCQRSGREAFLDALQLEALTWLDDEAFRTLLAEPLGPPINDEENGVHDGAR